MGGWCLAFWPLEHLHYSQKAIWVKAGPCSFPRLRRVDLCPHFLSPESVTVNMWAGCAQFMTVEQDDSWQ